MILSPQTKGGQAPGKARLSETGGFPALVEWAITNTQDDLRGLWVPGEGGGEINPCEVREREG